MTVKIDTGSTAETPPPGAGFDTLTDVHPSVVNCGAGIVALSCVALPYDVATGVPPISTVDVFVKLDPVTVIVVSLDPARIAVGLTEVATGIGEYVLPVMDTVALA
jgi:hypothetical protein